MSRSVVLFLFSVLLSVILSVMSPFSCASASHFLSPKERVHSAHGDDDTDAEGNLWNACQRSESIRTVHLFCANIDDKEYWNIHRFGEPSNSGFKEDTKGWETFSLDGKFKTLTFDVGHLDLESDFSSVLNIYFEDVKVFTKELDPGMNLTQVSIGVSDVNNLKIEFEENGFCYGVLHAKIV